MPMPTIPGVPPETWEQILQILAQLNTSVVELGEQGITTFEQLRQWLTLQGYELVEISEVVGYTIAKTEAVDPATTNAVANRVATDIVATGGAGTAVTQFVTGGNRTLGLVPKVVAVGACLSMLVSLIGAGLVSDEIKEDLITSADPYTIDGENVPVLIDENGKTHFLEEMVEAIRAKAIELGIFDKGYTPDYGETPIGTRVELNSIDFGEAISIMRGHAQLVAVNDNWGFTDLTASEFDTVVKSIIEAYSYTGEVHFTAGGSSQYEFYATPIKFNITGFFRYSSDITSSRYIFTNEPLIDISTIITYKDINAGSDGAIHDIEATNFNSTSDFGFSEYALYRNIASETTSDIGSWSWRSWFDQYGARVEIRIEVSNGKVVYVKIPCSYRYIGAMYDPTHIANHGIDLIRSGSVVETSAGQYMTMRGYGLNRRGLIFNGSEGTGVEGITPAQDLITAGVADATKPLTEVLPQLATGQMSIASPTENDLTHKSNWYPVSINSEDVFTDGATEEETSSATDGEVKQNLQPAILDAIQELIEQLNPDGTPDITVSDSGDTPPENPPLTPSAGTDGSNGLWAIYNPTLAQVQQFGAWLWSDTLADQFKRIFNSPIDGVIGFHMLYCTPSRGADQTIKCGFLASPVTSRTVASPYVEIDCGTVSIGEFYRNALDYDYTRISVYLPFIGIVPLDTNIVMGSDLNITYRVDVLTGTCLAQIKVIKENSDAVMYAFEGNCAVQIPLTATTYTGMVGALMSGVSAGIGVMTGNIAQAVTSGANALANMVSGKSGVKQSGTLGANAGALGIRKPYVIITHPIAYMPVNFNKLEGLPSNITATLGTLTGFTRVRSVHLENIGTATQEEINMIEELLKEGVII